MSEPKKSKATQEYESNMLHFNKEKHGRIPRAAGVAPEDEQTVPQAAPSHGVSDRGKSNEHGHKYGKYPKGKKVSAGGDDHEG